MIRDINEKEHTQQAKGKLQGLLQHNHQNSPKGLSRTTQQAKCKPKDYNIATLKVMDAWTAETMHKNTERPPLHRRDNEPIE